MGKRVKEKETAGKKANRPEEPGSHLSAPSRGQPARADLLRPAPSNNGDKMPAFAKGLRNSSEKMAGSLKDSFKLFAIFCVAFIVIGAAASMLFSDRIQKPSLLTRLDEGGLAKNSELGIREGDSLTYEVRTNASRARIRIQAGLLRGCPGLFVADVTRYGDSSTPAGLENGVCLGPDGVETGPDGQKLGDNMSFSNLTWPYFQPWMLALDRNFTWKANLSLVVEPFNSSQTQEITWRTVGERNYSGRDAYEVRVEGGKIRGDAPVDLGFGLDRPITYWVDKERRVLLFMQEGDANVSLVQAPFLPEEGKLSAP